MLRFKIGPRNDSRWASIKIALNAAVWHAPATLISTMRPMVVGIVQSVGIGVMTMLTWVAVQLMILYFGFAGRLVLSDNDKD